jgi:hypothetical protein
METEDGWVGLGALGQRLATIASDFDPRTYGSRKLSNLVREPRRSAAAKGCSRREIFSTASKGTIAPLTFHVAMWLQHAKRAAIGLSIDEPDRKQAKTVGVAEAERLRWRKWNGKAKDARRSIDRIRKVMHHSKQQMRWSRTGADSSAPGSLCGLQRHVRIRVRPSP